MYQVRVIMVFTVFRLLTDFVCLYNYEFLLSLCKIVRSSVILSLPLFIYIDVAFCSFIVYVDVAGCYFIVYIYVAVCYCIVHIDVAGCYCIVYVDVAV